MKQHTRHGHMERVASAVSAASEEIRKLEAARHNIHHLLQKLRGFARSRNPNISMFEKMLHELAAQIADLVRREKLLNLPDAREQHEITVLRRYIHHLEERLGRSHQLLRALIQHNKLLAKAKRVSGRAAGELAKRKPVETAKRGSSAVKELSVSVIRASIAKLEQEYYDLRRYARDKTALYDFERRIKAAKKQLQQRTSEKSRKKAGKESKKAISKEA